MFLTSSLFPTYDIFFCLKQEREWGGVLPYYLKPSPIFCCGSYLLNFKRAGFAHRFPDSKRTEENSLTESNQPPANFASNTPTAKQCSNIECKQQTTSDLGVCRSCRHRVSGVIVMSNCMDTLTNVFVAYQSLTEHILDQSN